VEVVMKKLVIIEPCYNGKDLLRQADAMRQDVLVLARTGLRVEALKELAPRAEVVQIDTSSEDDLVRYLSERVDIGGVVSGSEFLMPVVGRVIEHLGLDGIMTGRTGTVAHLKDQMRLALQTADVNQPQFRIVTDVMQAALACREIGYPCILKPTNLAGSLYVNLVRNEEELRSAYHSIRDASMITEFMDEPSLRLLVEEYVQGPEFSIESFSEGGEVKFASITEKTTSGAPNFIELAHVSPPVSLPIPESRIFNFVKQVLDALEIRNGTSHCEVVITDDGPKVIECACRNGGDRIMWITELATGVNLLKAQVLAAQNKPADVKRKRYGAAAIKFITSPDEANMMIDYDPIQLRSCKGYFGHALPNANVSLSVQGVKSFQSRIGYIVCRGETAFEARHNAERVARKLTFHRSRASNWLVSSRLAQVI
jgi:biotin carboxylase